MAALESRLVIQAIDETGAAFAAVEARIKALQASLAAINPAIGSVGQAAAQVWPAAQAVSPLVVAPPPRSPAPAPGPATPGSTPPPAVGAVNTLLGVAATLTGIEAIKGGFEEAAAQQHEIMRQRVQSLTAEQIAEGEKAAAELSKKYPSISQSDLMHLYRTGVTIAGQDEALDLLEPMARLRVVAQAARPGASPEEQTEEMDKLLKSAEIANFATQPAKFKSYINSVAKVLNAFGDQLKPSDIFEQLKYARQASSKLSERFITTTMATIGSEIGGASIGTAVASFNRAMVGGHMEHQAALEMARLGLFSESDLIRLKTGEVKGIKRGSLVQGWQMAQSDPDQWISQVLMPALKAHGISSPDELAAEVSYLYPNRTAGQFASVMTTQQTKLAKNAELLRKAMGDEAADVLSKEDIHATMTGVGNRIKNFISTQVPTSAISTGFGAIGSVLSGITPPPFHPDFWQDLKTDMQGWHDVFKSVHVGGGKFGESMGSPDVMADQAVVRANWNARYFDDEARADAARERSRGMALSGLPMGGVAAPAPPAPPQEINVQGQADVRTTVTVTASSELISIVDQAKQLRTQVPLNPVAGGHNGRMDSDAAPMGHGGVGHF